MNVSKKKQSILMIDIKNKKEEEENTKWFCFFVVDGVGLSVMLMNGLITFILNSNHKLQDNFWDPCMVFSNWVNLYQASCNNYIHHPYYIM